MNVKIDKTDRGGILLSIWKISLILCEATFSYESNDKKNNALLHCWINHSVFCEAL